MIDDESPIIDFYPGEFSIDMNGKKMAWQGVALLPFIDPERLLDAMGTKYPELTEDENNRNTMGADTLFVSQDHPLYDYLEGLYTKRKIKEVSIRLFCDEHSILMSCDFCSPYPWTRNEAKESLEQSFPIPTVSPDRRTTLPFLL